MRTTTGMAILIAFVAIAIAPSSANADGSTACRDQAHCGGACDGWARISKNDATCLAAWWDNSPSISTGVVGGSTYGAKNTCSSYGDMKVHVDLRGGSDQHFHLNDGSKDRGKSGFHDVRDISCCANKSEICNKNQVEADDDGYITRLRPDESMKHVYKNRYYVDDRSNRYEFCLDYPDDVFCEVDPEGDAQTIVVGDRLPVSELRERPCGGEGEPHCNCSDHICDYGDCQWHFNQSSARDTCRLNVNGASVTYDEDARECTVVAKCKAYEVSVAAESWGGTGTSYWVYRWGFYTGGVWNLDDLHNCSGDLKLNSC